MPRLTFSSSDGKDKDAKRKFGGGKMRAFPTGASVVGKMRAFGDGAARKKNDGPSRVSVLSRVTGGISKFRSNTERVVRRVTTNNGKWKHDMFPGSRGTVGEKRERNGDLRSRLGGGKSDGRVVRLVGGGVGGGASRGNLRNTLGGAPRGRSGSGQEQVASFLRGLDLGKYVGVFKSQEIDVSALQAITDRDLENLGLPLGPRKKIMAAKKTAFRGF